MSEVKKIGNSHVINLPGVGVGVYRGSVTASNPLDGAKGVSWEAEPETVAGKKIVPYGEGNNLPVQIRNIMDQNNLAPGILEREKGLLFGQGLELYKKVYENGEVRRVWEDDKDIWRFLKDWDYMRYLEMAVTEYKYLKGIFIKKYRNRGVRIGGKGMINQLEVVPGTDARLEWVNSRRLEDVKHIYVGDFENDCGTGIKTYNVFDAKDPFRYPVAMSYHNSYSFARNLYSVPGYYGTLNWISRSSDIPQILKYLTDNSLNLAFQISSPQQYWENKEEKLQEKCRNENIEYNPKMLEDHKEEILKKLSEVLAGKENVGKFFHTVSMYDDDGNLVKWEITPIDQKVKDFIEAQIKVSEKADSATTSGIGLHPALSNIMVDGKLSSGSEMLYALKLYLASDTTIPEEIVLAALNQAIEINFPNKDIKAGFYHKIVLREEDVKPSDRAKNNI